MRCDVTLFLHYGYFIGVCKFWTLDVIMVVNEHLKSYVKMHKNVK